MQFTKLKSLIMSSVLLATVPMSGCNYEKVEAFLEPYASYAEQNNATKAAADTNNSSVNSSEEAGIIDDTEAALEIVKLDTILNTSNNRFSCEYAFESTDTNQEIPYIGLKNGTAILTTMSQLLHDDFAEWGYTYDEEKSQAYISRENGSFVAADWREGIIGISDADAVKSLGYSSSNGDFVTEVGTLFDENGYPLINPDESVFVHYIERQPYGNNLAKRGASRVFNLKQDYRINVINQDGEVYIPLATFNDIFAGRAQITYNGENVFVILTGLDDAMADANGNTAKELFYSKEPAVRSEKLADFTYNELCFFLDMNYGLKAEHNIMGSFDSYFEGMGIKDKLLSTNPGDFEKALAYVMFSCFGDRHSGVNFNSAYAGEDFNYMDDGELRQYINLARARKVSERFLSARDEAGISENGIVKDAYSEVGDTAFLTFDTFSSYHNQDYYFLTDEEIAGMYAADTEGLVIYANQMINRAESPVKKVVIDLSNNHGGELDPAVYLVSWILGECDFSIINSITDAEYTTVYKSDVTLDGYVNDDDHLNLDNLDVYCLINGNSFSSANLVAALLKEDGRVTLLGQTSGGGGCIVSNSFAADSTSYAVSGANLMSTLKCGTYSRIDQGIEPDIAIRHAEKFYDREWMSEWLNTIP